MRNGKARIKLDGALQKADRPGILARLDLREMPQPAMVALPRIQALRQLAGSALALAAFDCRQDRRRDAGGDLVLHCKNICQVAVVAVDPEMAAGSLSQSIAP